MADADILRDLREQVLDESQSLDGLLRKCLALGAVTGSDELRAWANNELKGYADTAPLPDYRQLPAPLFVDSTSGPMSTTGEQISRMQVPSDLRQYVPEALYLRHPIKELIHLASIEKSTKMAADTFSSVAAFWTQQLESMFQKIDALYFKVLPSSIGGVVDTVRTTLVEMVFDMTKDVPLDKLPSQAKVDQVVQVHVGSNNYEVNVSGPNSGNIGQGSNISQVQNNSIPTELVDLLSRLRAGLTEVKDSDQRAEAEQAIDDFEESVSEDNPQPEKIKRRWGWLERIVTPLGTAVLTQAVKDGAPVVMDHLQLLM